MNMRKILLKLTGGLFIVFVCQFFIFSPNSFSKAEATIVPIANEKYMVNIDDSSIVRHSASHAAVGIKVFHDRHGWGDYFVVDVNWSGGTSNASARRLDTGAKMSDELAETLAVYLENN